MPSQGKTSIPALPQRTPFVDDDGNITRPWLLALQGLSGTAASAGAATGKPVQPQHTEWTLTLVEYGYDEIRRKALAHLRATVTTNPAGVAFFSAFAFAGSNPPSDPAQYKAVGDQPKAQYGDTHIDWWVDRPDGGAVTYQVVVTASSSTYQTFPDGSQDVKSVVVTVPGPPAQVTNFSVSVIYEDLGGVSTGRLVYAWTPPSDPEYFSANVYRILTDSSYTPLAGETWHLVANAVAGYTQQKNLENWPLGAESWWQFKVQSVARAKDAAGNYIENTTNPPTSNLHVVAASGGAAGSGPPTQPATGDWSVSVYEYGFDEARGVSQAHLRVVITPNPSDVVFFSAFSYPGGSPPSDPAQYVAVTDQPKAASGSTHLDWWVDSPKTGSQTYQIVVTASSSTYQTFPSSTNAVKTVTVNAPTAPPQVTGFSVTLHTEDRGGVPSGALAFSFTPPNSPDWFTTRIYRIQTDSSYTPLGGATWNLVASPNAPFDQRDAQQWWALGDAEAWFTFKIQSVARAKDGSGNYLENTTSPPTANLHIPVSSGVVANVTQPTQPLSTDWTLTVAEYGRDSQTGENLARLQIVMTANPSDVTYFSAWQFQGASPPASLSSYVDVCDTKKEASGSTTLTWWVTRQSSAATFQIAFVASSYTYTTLPTSTTVVKSIVVNAVSAPAQVTGFSVAVFTDTRGGVPSGALGFSFTPPSDPEFFTTHIYRQQTDSSYTPLAGATLDLVGSSPTSYDQRQLQQWWPLGATDAYFTFYCRSYSRANVENTVSAPSANLHIPASTGLNLGSADTASLNATDLQIASGQLGIKNVDLGKALGSSFNSAEFRLSGGVLTVNGVDLTKAISSTITNELAISGGKFGVAQLSAAKITAGTLAAGVVYAGSITASQIVSGTIASNIIYAGTINVSQLLAGSAAFSADVTFARTSGGSVVINSAGVQLKNASGYGITLDASGYITFTDNTNWTISITSHNITGVGQLSSVQVVAGGAGGWLKAAVGADFRVDGTVVINSSAQFVGAGVNSNAGVAGTGFNIYGGVYFGQTNNLRIGVTAPSGGGFAWCGVSPDNGSTFYSYISMRGGIFVGLL